MNRFGAARAHACMSLKAERCPNSEYFLLPSFLQSLSRLSVLMEVRTAVHGAELKNLAPDAGSTLRGPVSQITRRLKQNAAFKITAS